MKNILVAIIFLASIISCSDVGNTINDSSIEDALTEANEVEEQADKPIFGISTSENLRIRDYPDLYGNIIGKLRQGQEVKVLKRTSWEEQIDNFETYWFQIQIEDFTGWVYGGYLDLADIPVAASIDKRSYIETSFSGGIHISQENIEGFDIFLMGADQLFWIDPNGTGRRIELDENAILLISPPEPITSMSIEVESTEGIRFERIYTDFPEIYYEEPAQSEKLDELVLWIPFTLDALGAYGITQWTISVIINEIVTTYVFDTNDYKFFLVSNQNSSPDPFINHGNHEVQYGKTLYFFGNTKESNQDYYIVIYKGNENYPQENGKMYLPAYAVKIVSDANGIIAGNIILGHDLGEGEFRIGYGYSVDKISAPWFNKNLVFNLK